MEAGYGGRQRRNAEHGVPGATLGRRVFRRLRVPAAETSAGSRWLLDTASTRSCGGKECRDSV